MDKLPSELMLRILLQMDDLPSLDSVTRANAAAYRVFKAYSRELMEAALKTDQSCGHVKVLMRHVALICAGKYWARSMDHLIDDIIFYDIGAEVKYDRRQDDSPSWITLGDRIIRHILRTAGNIHRAMIGCISLLHHGFIQLQPEHPVDEKFQYLTPGIVPGHHKYVPVWISRPAGYKVPTPTDLQPVWAEEQRVLRAFWRIQMVYELKLAGRQRRLNWAKEDLDRLAKIHAIKPVVDEFVGSSILRNRYRDTPKTVLIESMSKVAPEPTDQIYTFSAHYKIRDHGRHREHCSYPFKGDVPSEYEEMVTVIEYLRETYGCARADAIASANRPIGHIAADLDAAQRTWPVPETPTDSPYLQDMFRPTPAASFAWTVLRDMFTGSFSPFSPLQITGLQPFTRLGFMLWSQSRMVRYGLLAKDWSCFRTEYHFAWHSVLTDDENHAFEERCRERMDVHRGQYVHD